MGINGRAEPRPRYVVLPEEVLDLHDWDEYLSLLDETGPFKCLRSSTSGVSLPFATAAANCLCEVGGVQKQRLRAVSVTVERMASMPKSTKCPIGCPAIDVAHAADHVPFPRGHGRGAA